ncbi:MAG TPA: flagellar basal body-associated FliL family protein [Candidatus Binatia bacterium]|nr:flagellar basal body-associated FliL family protein [Candidatus Binatia bacterium]
MAAQPTMTAKASGTAQAIRRAAAIVGGLTVVVGLVGWFVWSSQAAQREAERRAPGGVRAVIHLENFIVNLSGAQETSFLRVGIDLGSGLEEKEIRDEHRLPFRPRVRDVILGVLATRTSEDLMTSAGKNKLKQDVLQAVQERIPELQVREIYFTEFLVQR